MHTYEINWRSLTDTGEWGTIDVVSFSPMNAFRVAVGEVMNTFDADISESDNGVVVSLPVVGDLLALAIARVTEA